MSRDTLSDLLRSVHLHGAAFFYVSCRGEWCAGAPHSREIAQVVLPGSEHVMEYHMLAKGDGWAAVDGGALTDGLEGMRRGAESLREQNALVFDGLIKIALSEAEVRAGDHERAIAALDEALAMVRS